MKNSTPSSPEVNSAFGKTPACDGCTVSWLIGRWVCAIHTILPEVPDYEPEPIVPFILYDNLDKRDKYYLRKRRPICELCRMHRSENVDHCHREGHGWVRGILCAPCNRTVERVALDGMSPKRALMEAVYGRVAKDEPPDEDVWKALDVLCHWDDIKNRTWHPASAANYKLYMYRCCLDCARGEY